MWRVNDTNPACAISCFRGDWPTFKERERRKDVQIGILDDNSAILDLLSLSLQMTGHTVYTHMTSSSLLEVLFPSSPNNILLRYDLVILDLNLAETYSGADLLIMIRKTLSAEQLPIILMTAADGSTIEEYKRILPGDVPLLRKPFRQCELLQVITQSKPSS